ncbi:MAG: Fe-Mn family superoxide dismutase [Steroidobacteraceae bacterium]
MASESRRAFMQQTLAASALATTLAGSARGGEAAAAGTATPALTPAPAAPAAPPAPAFDLVLAPKPLPFDPKSLHGISERLIVSHWENNYTGAVKALNAIRARLAAAAADASTPPYLYTGLKREQLLRTGSVVYHEHYFGNLGGGGGPGARLRSLIARSFGSYDAWETEFRKIGNGLAGGSGWAVLAWNPTLKVLENYWLGDHAHGSTTSQPVLVMDMYEHAYQMDYGAAAAKYIDAFFASVQWETVEARLAASGA